MHARLHHHSRRDARSGGFSLIEMLIVISVIAIIATVAVPNYMSSKRTANEKAVVATMRKIATSQLLFRQSGFLDLDRNGQGEFGFLGELSGISPLRGKGEFLQPPVLNPAFGYIDADGFAERRGYLFRVYLPDASGVGLPETPSNIGNIDAENAGLYFTCLAWPMVYGRTGQRTFFMNQQGDVHFTVDSSYTGHGGAPIANAGLVGVPTGVITTNSLATGGNIGIDGNRWVIGQ